MKYYYDRARKEIDGELIWEEGWRRGWGRTIKEQMRYSALFCAANLTLLKKKLIVEFQNHGKGEILEAITKEQVLKAGNDGIVIKLCDDHWFCKKTGAYTTPHYIKIFAK